MCRFSSSSVWSLCQLFATIMVHILSAAYSIFIQYTTSSMCRLSSWKYSSDNICSSPWLRSHGSIEATCYLSLQVSTPTPLWTWLSSSDLLSCSLPSYHFLLLNVFLYIDVQTWLSILLCPLFPWSFMSLLVLYTALSSQRLGPLFIRSKDNPNNTEEGLAQPLHRACLMSLQKGNTDVLCDVCLLHSGYCNKCHRLNDL